jgi:hypothetical protein
MKKKRTVFIAIALVAPLLLFVLPGVYDGLADLTVDILDYPHVKNGSSASITLAVTNHFYFKSQRIAAIEIERESSYSTSLRCDVKVGATRR